MEKNVVRFEHRIGFELAAPETLRMLLRENEVPRPGNRRLDVRQVCIEPTESWYRGRRRRLRLRLLKFHSVWNAAVPPWDLKTRLEAGLYLLVAIDKGQKPGPEGRSILLSSRGLKHPAPSGFYAAFAARLK